MAWEGFGNASRGIIPGPDNIEISMALSFVEPQVAGIHIEGADL
jgi:hypothetical protein